MVRAYDSSRRRRQAARTREAILEAAFRLHGLGILDLERLAEEANVSVATVRSHFPTREQLYEGCTAHGLAAVTLPDLDAIGAIEDPADRAYEAVAQVFALHEQLLGHTWMAMKLEDESAALAAVLGRIDATVSEAAAIVVAAWPAAVEQDCLGFVTGMLSPLTYRALRVSAGLTPADTVRLVAESLVRAAEAAREAGGAEVAYR